MTRTRRLGITGLATLLGTSLALVVTAAPVQAAAPVTVADAASMYAGNLVEVQPLANDSDADGDDLAICRIADSTYKRVELVYGFGEDGEISDTLLLLSRPSAKPGTYTFTYYACDFQTLVAGTITLTINEPPDITAKALPGRPGKIKVTNPADFKIRYLYGSFKEPNPDGTVKIAKNSSVILTVRRTQIDWIAFTRKGDFLTRGRIKNITLPPGTTPPAAGRYGPRVTTMWGAGV
ncbi:MAG: Ig-like domain-containing protein [Nocardioides sp.]